MLKLSTSIRRADTDTDEFVCINIRYVSTEESQWVSLLRSGKVSGCMRDSQGWYEKKCENIGSEGLVIQNTSEGTRILDIDPIEAMCFSGIRYATDILERRHQNGAIYIERVEGKLSEDNPMIFAYLTSIAVHRLFGCSVDLDVKVDKSIKGIWVSPF